MKHLLEFICCSSILLSTLSQGAVDGLKKNRPYFNHPTCPKHPPPVDGDRRCLKKCMTNADCRGSKRRCLCDGRCGNSCVRIGMKCRLPDEVANGRFEMASRNTFGAIVRYSCNRGYVLSAEQTDRVCQGDGRWSGQAPTCETQGQCGLPPVVKHSDHNGSTYQTTFAYGTLLTYQCRSGYEAIGYRSTLCLGEGRWTGPNMNCSPRRCNRPTEIPNGRLESAESVYESRVNYSCIPGYELLGRPYRVCQADGTWSGTLPMCRPRRCPPPRPIVNGFISGTDHAFDSMIHYRCRQGFKLIGQKMRRCRHDQQWSDSNPICTLVDCGPMGQLYGGVIAYRPSTVFNSTAVFKCIQDSKSGVGDEMMSTCLDSGRWSHPLPKCWKSCKKPKEILNSHWKQRDEDDLDEWVDNGTALNFSCQKDFVKERHSVCVNGSWSQPPRCVPSTKSCFNSRPNEIQDGYFRFYSSAHGDRARYMCDPGYQLKGNPVLICRDGEWIHEEGQIPLCNRTECDYPGTIENGEILLVGVIGKFIYRHYVRRIYHNEQILYQCLRNYTLIGPSGATCVSGTWSPARKPFCVPKRHFEMEFDRLLTRGRRELRRGRRRRTRSAESPLAARWPSGAESRNGSDVSRGKNVVCCSIPSIRHGATVPDRRRECVQPGTSLRVVCRGRRSVSVPVAVQCKEKKWRQEVKRICSKERGGR